MDQGVIQISRIENYKYVSVIKLHFELPVLIKIVY